MPPRISIASLRSLKQTNASRSFCCTQCLAHRSAARVNLRNRITSLRDARTNRFVSTFRASDYVSNEAPAITPALSINKPLDVASSNKELYRALERLKTDAANYVGISRLGLALRSLEGKDGIVRVAVLAMDGDVQRVKRLVRLLLADPLGKQDAWETELAEGSNGESLLIRYALLPGSLQTTTNILQIR